MKATYIKPQTDITIVEFEAELCEGSGLRKADFGAGDQEYSNAAWTNEGWGDVETPVIVGNDDGQLNSTAKGSSFGSIWEDD